MRTRNGVRAFFTAVIRGQITGPGAAALLAELPGLLRSGQPLRRRDRRAAAGNVHVAEEAFRWVAYTPAAAVIDLVSAGPGAEGTTVRASTRLQVVWDGGDWKVIAPPGGDWGHSAAELSSLSGYTLFPGQGGGR